MFTTKIKNHLLFCPGPVNVSSNIWGSMINQIGHREEEFSELLTQINERLLQVYEVKDANAYYPVVITGSGTVANETVLSSVVGKKHILVLTNGEFGERLAMVSQIHNTHTHILSSLWGEKMNLSRIESYLRNHPVDIIAMVHHETSTGMLNPISEIGLLAKKYRKMFIIDAVSSATAEKIDLEAWNITFCTTSSGKAMSSLPGLGIIIGKTKAFEELKNQQAKTAYMDLYKLYYYSKTLKQTPNTPAVHLFYALNQSLANILQTGVENWRNTIHKRALELRKDMKQLGLQFLLNEKDMSSCLTTVMVPSYLSIEVLKKKLKEKNIVIYNGKGPLLNKVFQVGNMGELDDSNIYYFCKTLREIVTKVRSIEYEYKNADLHHFRQYFHLFVPWKIFRHA